jgi:hypothetical protein
MADNVVTLPNRGQTYLTGPNRTADTSSTTTKAIQGIRKTFKDIDYSSTNVGVKPPRSGGEVQCILVRNSSGIALLPGRTVIWKSTAQGKEVDGYTHLDALVEQQCAGVVDEFLPTTGVPNNDYFWLVVKGPCLIKKSLDANTLAKDTYVVAITAATSQATTAGRIINYVQTSNATVASNQAANKIGIAMSTSNTTAANILVYVDLA